MTVSAVSLVLDHNVRDPRRLASAIVGGEQNLSRVEKCSKYAAFKWDLQITPRARSAVADLRKHCVFGRIEGILGLNTDVGAELKQHKEKAVGSGGVAAAVSEHQSECDELKALFEQNLRFTQDTTRTGVEWLMNAEQRAEAMIRGAQCERESILNQANEQAHQRMSQASRAAEATTERAKQDALAIVKEAEKMADKLVDRLSTQLDARFGATVDALEEAVLKKAAERGIIEKGLRRGQHVRFVVKGKEYEIMRVTLDKYDDFLSAIARTDSSNVNDDGSIRLDGMTQEAFEILLNFRKGVNPGDDDLIVARDVADQYSCVPLIEYCDDRLQRLKFPEEQRALSNIITRVSGSDVRFPSTASDVDARLRGLSDGERVSGKTLTRIKQKFLRASRYFLESLSRIDALENVKRHPEVEASGFVTKLHYAQGIVKQNIEVVEALEDVHEYHAHVNNTRAEAQAAIQPVIIASKNIRRALASDGFIDFETGKWAFKYFMFILRLT